MSKKPGASVLRRGPPDHLDLRLRHLGHAKGSWTFEQPCGVLVRNRSFRLMFHRFPSGSVVHVNVHPPNI